MCNVLLVARRDKCFVHSEWRPCDYRRRLNRKRKCKGFLVSNKVQSSIYIFFHKNFQINLPIKNNICDRWFCLIYILPYTINTNFAIIKNLYLLCWMSKGKKVKREKWRRSKYTLLCDFLNISSSHKWCYHDSIFHKIKFKYTFSFNCIITK